MNQNLIEIQNVSKRYNKNTLALKDVNLTLKSGLFGLLGPNGSGKTTLMRILSGIMQPTEGKVNLLGYDLNILQQRQAAKAHLGYLPQQIGTYPQLSAREFLRFIARFKQIDQVNHEVERVLEIVRLTEDADRHMRDFSGGMKRRIGIAQALLGNPGCIIVDEPTTGLDPEERLRIRNTLAQIATESIVILSTHIIDDISQSCRQVGILDKGQILFQGELHELITTAEGKVGQIYTQNNTLPPENLNIVSIRQLANGMQYRVLSEHLPAEAEIVQATLEDGYLWIMQQKNNPA
ncbi:ABC transporter ATP-binding protein [Anaerolineales bacterium]